MKQNKYCEAVNGSMCITGNDNVVNIGVPIKHYINLQFEYCKLMSKILQMQDKITDLTLENITLKQKLIENGELK